MPTPSKKKPAAKKPSSVNMEEDSTENRVHSSAELSQVSDLASRLIQIQKAKEVLGERIAALSEEEDRIQGADLPGLMDEIGLKEFKLKSGDQVVVKPVIKGSIPAESAILREKDIDKRSEMRERFETALIYLEKNGAGAMIKNMLVAELGKDSTKLTKAAVAALKKLKIHAELSRGVHPGSLNSWIKERIENGTPPDFDLFKIYSGTRAEVKKAKPKDKPAKSEN